MGGFTIDVPTEFENFHKLIGKLTDKHDLARVFDDWLEYIIIAWLSDNSMTWDKNYTRDEIRVLWDMYCELVKVTNERLVTDNDWFDFPGVYYESCVSTPYQRDKSGQFFTPPDICTLMATMNLAGAPSGPGLRVNDPTSGSGRCLLAVHVQRPGCYLVAEDLDHTCVLMAVVNFLTHGVVGEVIWHNTLTQDFYGAWKVNEALNTPANIPSIRSISEEEYKLSQMVFSREDVAMPEMPTTELTKQTTLGGFEG